MVILCTLVQQTIFSRRCILWYRGLVRLYQVQKYIRRLWTVDILQNRLVKKSWPEDFALQVSKSCVHGLVLCKSITSEIEVGASVDLNLKTF